MESVKSSTDPIYAEVVVNSTINKVLDYSIPLKFQEKVSIGTGVIVPLRGGKKSGVVTHLKASTQCTKVLPIIKIIDSNITLSKDLLELMFWMSQYYFTPLGKTVKLFLPGNTTSIIQAKQLYKVSLKASKNKTLAFIDSLKDPNSPQAKVLKTLLHHKKPLGLSTLSELSKVSQSPISSLQKLGFLKIVNSRENELSEDNVSFFAPEPKQLNPDQQAAFDQMKLSIDKNMFQTHLLFGVTGSGKTEIYYRCISHTLSKNKNVILLVPEIALTIQTVNFLKAHFGSKIAVLHHKLSDSDKNQTWRDAANGLIRIIIGPRSALFCPIQNLGLIIVDEEHDQAYKQQDSVPCYHARDVAVMRGKLSQATVILSSATPSLESYNNAINGKYTLSVLSQKAEAVQKPTISLIDMNTALEKNLSKSLFSSQVLNGIEKRLQKGEQSLIFFNRRGYHTNVTCSFCKHALKCVHCDMVLTYHKYENKLVCHLCNYSPEKHISQCPECKGSMTLQYRGSGTEKIERHLYAIFPSIKIVRIDSDTTKSKGSHYTLLKQFATGKADILIGTQMIAKGMHFPSVTLAVVLNGDSGLYIPDFRASEQVFQLITQVSGRSGRSRLPGEILIQTFLPENKTILHALKQDYDFFYKEEIYSRELCIYPPFTRLIRCIFIGSNPKETLIETNKVRDVFNSLTQFNTHNMAMNTSPCGHFKIKDTFRYQFLIKTKNILATNKYLQEALVKAKLSSKTRFIIDVDPITTFF